MYCGIDEAGRGSVMGPLVVASVSAESDEDLIRIGVKDSKKLSPARREAMYSEIAECADWRISVASAEEIDSLRKEMSLNEIELRMFCRVVPPGVSGIIADCPDVNEESFTSRFRSALGSDAEFTVKHKADDTYPVVSAASIVAKVTRDRMMEDIRGELGETGSGYPSDRVTMNFIENWIVKNKSAPPHVRCSWEPVRAMLSKRSNTKLDDW